MVAAIGFFGILPGLADRTANVAAPGPYAASERAVALVQSSLVIDLHADSFLWGRDLLARSAHGHVDLPRMVEGNVALQVFAAPTKTPAGINFERNSSDAADIMTPLVVAQRWPLRTWGSLRERALFQLERFEEAAERSEGRLRVLRSRGDLDAFLAEREGDPDLAAGLMALEGLHALEGELESVDRLFEAGYRMLGLAHFFDNEASGSSAGEEKHGLTELGRAVIARMEELGLTVDLAHAASASIRDVLAIATEPMVVSHTGVQATCPGPRNLTDDEIIGIAELGGVIGVAYFEGAVCDTSPRGIVRAMRHVRDLVGSRHIALGSDFDGSVTTVFDSTGVPLVVDALLEDGFDEDEVRMILGGNALRVLRQTLPE